ncbi:MAG: UDP-N-acetylmuramoyl-L-alanine--D-glutamate ligase [Fusobacteriaceae bacterium]|nr:UDP-N-acetylmuramoyl-L-alanine--D-glutamate ligase [Fusobacteriaceae bacterium]
MKKAMVFGAGKSGLSAKKILEKNRYEVILVDDSIGMKSQEAIGLLDDIELFVKSPGIPYVDLVKRAIEKKIPVVDEIEVSFMELKKNSSHTKIIAVTGTNGKTTTTAKTAELLSFAGYKSTACGNIGKPFGEVVLDEIEYDYIVIELSSFQLENLINFKSDIAILINLTPDHLERYNNIEEYYDVKFNIGINQKFSDKFIINMEDKESLKRIDRITGEVLGVTTKNSKDKYIFLENNSIMFGTEEILKVEELSLKGKHNLENMLFVAATAKIVGISNEILKKYLTTAKPIEHRLEDFFSYGQIKFINDSKATNVDSTKFAIEAYPESILICGGKDKHLDLTDLGKLVVENRMKEVYLIGENRNIILEKLRLFSYPENKIFDVENIDCCMQVLKSKLTPQEEGVVLFSPATSSYDQFENFEDRGRKFKEVVRKYFGG